MPASPVTPANPVMAAALRLFAGAGYEATTVDEIAAAAGISRRTFFRQFRSKEDVVFADHTALLGQAAEHLDAARSAGADPWAAVCEAAEWVFRCFYDDRDAAVLRYRVVNAVEALREREIVTVYRYERLFADFLFESVPGSAAMTVVPFAAAVTAGHNHLLRAMLRGDADATPQRLRAELAVIRRRLVGGEVPDQQNPQNLLPDALPPSPARPVRAPRVRVAVAVADGDADDREIAAAVRAELERKRSDVGHGTQCHDSGGDWCGPLENGESAGLS